MTRFAVWFTISELLVLPGSASDVQQCSVLTVEAAEKIHVLANPYLMDIFLPEQPRAAEVPVSSVPERARKQASLWIPKIVHERWLPADIDNGLVALKDVKQWEKRDKKGILISERVGDFLRLDYEVSGYRIHVQESGVSVSLRVDFPQPLSIADDPTGFIRKCLANFLNLPEGVVFQLDGDVKEESPVYFAYLRSPRVIERELAIRELALRVPPGQSFELNAEIRERARQWRWWDRVHVCTDGRFFFVRVSEIGEGRYNPRARPGLPDRF